VYNPTIILSIFYVEEFCKSSEENRREMRFSWIFGSQLYLEMPVIDSNS
jgi:hypothetical protein